MNNKKPILYSFRRCPYAIRARIVIKLCEQVCQLREINLNSKPDEFLILSPKATVPVLQFPDGSIIEESLEIINWAISINDPLQLKSKNQSVNDREMKLIKAFDDEFKFHLDRYKYSNRYKNIDKVFHRSKAEEMLSQLEILLSKSKWLRGKKIGIADIAILPFIRQFRIANVNWFDKETNLPNVKKWLNLFLESQMFTCVMEKYKPWKKGEEIIEF